jgi:hypothetical protein
MSPSKPTNQNFCPNGRHFGTSFLSTLCPAHKCLRASSLNPLTALQKLHLCAWGVGLLLVTGNRKPIVAELQTKPMICDSSSEAVQFLCARKGFLNQKKNHSISTTSSLSELFSTTRLLFTCLGHFASKCSREHPFPEFVVGNFMR